ncbi:MAG TPA: nitrate- and nitrite sensing domain-containing protein, partial [Acidimicrobiales bacterium]
MRRVPIRIKLAGALAVPLLALVVVTVLEVVKTAQDVHQIRSQTELAKASTGPAGLVTKLQNERTWPAVELIGNEDAVTVPTEGYEETRGQTDEALAAFRDEIRSRGSAVEATYAPVVDGMDEALEGIRADIDASRTPRDMTNIPFANGIYERYSQLIHAMLDANGRVTLQIDDVALRQGTELVDLTSQQIELVADMSRRTIIDSTLSENGIDTPDEIKTIAALQATFDGNNETVRMARPPYATVVEHHYPAGLTERLSANVDHAIATGRVGDIQAFLADLDVPRDEGWQGFRDRVVEAVNARADELNHAADTRERWYVTLSLGTLAAAVLLRWLVSRSITQPLRSLTTQAKDMADQRLPDAVLDILETPLGDDVQVPHVDPVRVRTRDEVADVADALNTVQDSALDLAVEQAVLRRNIADSFVNLGRRNQNLLGRQLDFITELESNETDPETLASLFRLDHLTTRMRRNAESLLVLAGIDPPRKWAAPVRLTDVIRAALGEVEDYQRVTVRAVEPATIVGSAAADLAHLLAEFIENALTFSPPDQTVEVRGRHRVEAQGYSLVVIDSGFGMDPRDLVQANRRLSGTESFTVAPSKYLGHYVAGNLAARHGIHLHLDSSPGDGIAATISIPPDVITTDRAAVLPGPASLGPPEPHTAPTPAA